MLTAWQDVLQEAGAIFKEGIVENFGDPAAERISAMEGDIVADLSRFGLIAVSGKDSESFLQGQFVNDLREVTVQHSQLSGACSPKGRLLASFRIIRRGETYYLQLARELLEPVLRRLRLYVLRSDVQLRDASEELIHIGFKGAGAQAAARNLLGSLPEKADDARQAGGLSLVRLHGDPPRFMALGPLEDVRPLWQALVAVARAVGSGAWSLTDILAGVPTIFPKTTDAFVPQMVNYQALGGVSFTKGCYTGQEIVARTQYLGKLKRRLYRAHVDSDAEPGVGEELFSPNFPGGQSVGRLAGVEANPGGGYEVLAVIQMESAEHDSVHLHDPRGPLLTLLPLPYPLET